jgi:hypothetical protein
MEENFMGDSAPSDAAIIRKYIEFRDALDEKAKAYAVEIAPLTEAMELLAGYMHTRLNERGDDSVKTEFGTAYRQRTMSVRTADKDALFNFVREADAFELLAGNVSKDAIKSYAEEHQGAYPPGIDVTFISKTLFRRS